MGRIQPLNLFVRDISMVESHAPNSLVVYMAWSQASGASYFGDARWILGKNSIVRF